jgi:hypothetical protein
LKNLSRNGDWILLDPLNRRVVILATKYILVITNYATKWVEGENTLHGGHFGHFHDMYGKYIFAKYIYGIYNIP